MVIGVSGRVDEQQRPAGKIDHFSIVRLQYAWFIHRGYATVQVFEALLAIYLGSAGNQLSGVNHVLRPFFVYHQLGVGAKLHQGAGAASMIQVNVGQNYQLDMIVAQPQFSKSTGHLWR